MSENGNGTLGLYGTEHSKCYRLMTLGCKGLMADRCGQGIKYRTQAWKRTISDPSGLMPN